MHITTPVSVMHHSDDWALAILAIKEEGQRECRKAYNSYVLSLIDNNNNVFKRMWSYIKSKR